MSMKDFGKRVSVLSGDTETGGGGKKHCGLGPGVDSDGKRRTVTMGKGRVIIKKAGQKAPRRLQCKKKKT